MNERIESLDWLRGLMAISIMAHHLTGLLFFTPDSSSLLGRLGIYAVSIFFIISGLSMALVYSRFITNTATSISFFIRRIFRIWPLLWVCIFLITIPNMVPNKPVNVLQIIANMTTLFGFIKPDYYMNAGAWSIGNEMVYYALTPLILIIYNRNKFFGDLMTIICLLISCYFAFSLLNGTESLSDQWATYINPFNNLFLYIAGIYIYYNLKDIDFKTWMSPILFISCLLFFIFYPVTGDQIRIVTGLNRLLFLFFSVLMVVAFYKFTRYRNVHKIIRYPLEKFGIATYGVYLLHPIVAMYLTGITQRLGYHNSIIIFLAAIILTIVMALLSFNLFENKMMAIGKGISKTFL